MLQREGRSHEERKIRNLHTQHRKHWTADRVRKTKLSAAKQHKRDAVRKQNQVQRLQELEGEE